MKALRYFLVSTLIFNLGMPLQAQPSQQLLVRLQTAKRTVDNHLKALSQCLHHQECSPQAIATATILMTSLITALFATWGIIGVIKYRKGNQVPPQQPYPIKSPFEQRPSVPVIPEPELPKPQPAPEPAITKAIKAEEAVEKKPSLAPLQPVPLGEDPLSGLVKEQEEKR